MRLGNGATLDTGMRVKGEGARWGRSFRRGEGRACEEEGVESLSGVRAFGKGREYTPLKETVSRKPYWEWREGTMYNLKVKNAGSAQMGGKGGLQTGVKVAGMMTSG